MIPAALVVTMAGLAAINISVMQALQVQPATLVLAHRGFSEVGVENTIQDLAAAAAGADLVELDVMETSDGQFVVLHDASWQRLAGQDLNVASLTLAEITAVQVTDTIGHSVVIPAFEDYLLRAQELELPLLVEIKLHGGEGPNLVPLSEPSGHGRAQVPALDCTGRLIDDVCRDRYFGHTR